MLLCAWKTKTRKSMGDFVMTPPTKRQLDDDGDDFKDDDVPKQLNLPESPVAEAESLDVNPENSVQTTSKKRMKLDADSESAETVAHCVVLHEEAVSPAVLDDVFAVDAMMDVNSESAEVFGEFDIPREEDVVPLLQKCGYTFCTGKWVLPSGNVTLPDLRKFLCSTGVQNGDVLSDDEYCLLRKWVRWSILSSDVIPTNARDPLSPRCIHRYLLRLGFRLSSGYYFYPGEEIRIASGIAINGYLLDGDRGLVARLCREGLPRYSEQLQMDPLSESERIRLELYISDCQYVNTFELADEQKRVGMIIPTAKPATKRAIKRAADPATKRTIKQATDSSRTTSTKTMKLSQLPLPATTLDPFPPLRHYGRRNPDFYKTLGQLRLKGETGFKWTGQLGYNKDLGRAYYSGFFFRGHSLGVGDFIKIGENSVNRIISAFQATKSFIGRWSSKEEEIQNRGFAYIELAPFHQDKTSGKCVLLEQTIWNPFHVEGLPFSLIETTLDIVKLKVPKCSEVFSGISTTMLSEHQYDLVYGDPHKFAARAFPAIMEARFVILLKTKRPWKLEAQERYTAFDSDDSDGCEVDKRVATAATTVRWDDIVLDNNIVPPQVRDSCPQPILMFSGPCWVPKSSLEKAEKLRTISQDIAPLLQLCEEQDPTLLKQPALVLRDGLLRSTALSRLEDHFEIHIVDQRAGDNMEKTWATMLPFHRYKSRIQQLACKHAVGQHNDTVLIAPCGAGKSLTFIQTALKSKGLHLVVEPLNTIIKSQLQELKHYTNLEIAQLYNEHEATARREPRARDKLTTILNDILRNGGFWPYSMSLLVFATPELVANCMSQLEAISAHHCLASITIDEVDMIQQGNGREVYMNIVSHIRQALQGGPKLLFLSGTITPTGLLGVLPPASVALNEKEKPALFVNSRALSNTLSFHVERKVSDKQVAERIAHWITRYKNKHQASPKALVYCLTPSRCKDMKELLIQKGVTAESCDSSDNESGLMESKVAAFRAGSTTVLCCTTVLGRGFHVADIRFVFHASVPMSMASYIQEAGRAGRDGKRSTCILFFAPEDLDQMRRIRLRHNANLKQIVSEDTRQITFYATSSACRYSQLARIATIPLCNPGAQQCKASAHCDNCNNHKHFLQTVHIKALTEVFDEPKIIVEGSKGKGHWLSQFLEELFTKTGVLEKQETPLGQSCLVPGPVFEIFNTMQVKFFVKKGRKSPSSISMRQIQMESPDTEPSDSILPLGGGVDLETLWEESGDPAPNDLRIPFLVRYEAERTQTDSTKLMSLIEKNEDELYFSAEMNQSGEIMLLPPESAISRRIFRKFGSSRFLHLLVPSDVPDDFLIEKLSGALKVCGRTYRYLWSKAQKRPQCYVLFAEDAEHTVDMVRSWCIPPEMNQDLTIGKELKRIKLSFSKTISTIQLPGVDSIEVIDDIVNEGNVMTDGCGLVSRDALDAMWAMVSKEEGESCPYASFQGRIGGYKGLWVSDSSLKGIKFQCRKSQLKYNVPDDVDDKYNVVEINSWERADKGHLNVRLVQILEERGIDSALLLRFVDEGLRWLDELSANDSKSPFHEIIEKHFCVGSEDGQEKDTFEVDNNHIMLNLAKVDRGEPFYNELLRKHTRRKIDGMLKRARYPVKDCHYVRMIPDHLGLLEESEAFVGLQKSLDHARHVLAFRNPSYFSADLRKLKLVQLGELLIRAFDKGGHELHQRCQSFFSQFKAALVLSTRGKESEAIRMSGGDYDGDTAWICYNPELVEQVQDCELPERKAEPEKHNQENILASQATIQDRLKLARHYKYHQQQLGYLANTLESAVDQLEPDHPAIFDIANCAFLQVDHPYKLCRPQCSTEDIVCNLRIPHWTVFSPTEAEKVYHSTKALGKIYDYVTEKAQEFVSGGVPTLPNSDILKYVQGHQDLKQVKKAMRSEIVGYKKERQRFRNLNSPDEWKQRSLALCQETRLLHFVNKSTEEAKIKAAVLYNECCSEGDRVVEFAWRVADDFLFLIIAQARAEKNRFNHCTLRF